MAPPEEKISTPLVPPNANVVYKEGPSEQLPQFGLHREETLSPLMSFQTAPSYVRTASPIHTPPFGAMFPPSPPSPVVLPRQPPSPALSAHYPPSPSPYPPAASPSRYSSALEVQRVSAHPGLELTEAGDTINIVEQIVYQPVVVEVEKIVEVPEIQYREVPVHKTVEVPEVVEQVVLKEIPVPQYVEIEVPQYVEKPKIIPIDRVKPVGVESITSVTYEVPTVETEYEIIPVPIYVPQFIEVPVPVEQMDEETQTQLESLANDIAVLTSGQYPSLSVLEDLFERSNHANPHLETNPKKMLDHWKYMAERGLLKTTAQPSVPRQSSSQFNP